MTVDVEEVISVLSTLANEKNLRVTVKESLKAGVIAGTATIVGGLLGGPVGIAIGGTIGAVSAAAMSYEKFESVGTILKNMDPKNKQILYEKVLSILEKVSASDVVMLQQSVVDAEIRQQLLDVVVDHVQKQLHMTIID